MNAGGFGRRWLLCFAVCGGLLWPVLHLGPTVGSGQEPERSEPPAATDLEAAPTFAQRLVAAALERTRHRVRYDGSYRRLAFPGGDVPDSLGVCTDLVIRSYRQLGIDLQEEVHRDMRVAFDEYPRIWGLTGPDANIDHRRVPNLQTFFLRQGAALPVTDDADSYLPGDLVTWMLPGNLPHIGVVVGGAANTGDRPLVVHNIGAGPVRQDMLFDFEITGHYRFHPVR